MPRASEYLSRNPIRLDISRSKFVMNPRWTGSFNAFELVPILTYTDVLPAETDKLRCSMVCRMSTPIVPVMDDLFMDIAFYFVPHELVLSRSYMSPNTSDSNHSFKAFIGAQDSLLNMPVPDSDIELPHMVIHDDVSYPYRVGGLADCMGLPSPENLGNADYWINCLGPLAFMAVWNENYREPSTQNPGVFQITAAGLVQITWAATGLGSSAAAYYWSSAFLPNVCRFHGYFGSCLPWPQRNLAGVNIPLLGTADVVGGSSMHETGSIEFEVSGLPSTATRFIGLSGLGDDRAALAFQGSSAFDQTAYALDKSNLVADLAHASGIAVNAFRLAVQEQRWFEALARGGNRIDELTAAMFGVMPKDAGGNQPEYLGGKRIPLQVNQVNVTANGGEGNNTKVGQTGAFSLTADFDYYFTKSFDKWGTIVGVACVRYRDSFGNSLNRMFTRHKRFDFYWPQFANLGEMAVYKHELDIDEATTESGGSWPTSDVFGYQEAWADYRYIPDVVTGLVRPGESLAKWTYSNSIARETDNTMVSNLAGFLAGTKAKNAIDRTLETPSKTAGFQFIAQFQFEIETYKPMPLHSIPGLVDHH